MIGAHPLGAPRATGMLSAIALRWGETTFVPRTRAVQDIVEAAADELGCAVAVDDAQLAARAYSVQPELIDGVRRHSVLRRCTSPEVTSWLAGRRISELREASRIPANPELGMWARICVPIRVGEHLLGYLWLFDEPVPVSDGDVALAVEFAAELAIALDDERREELELRAGEKDLMRRLIAGDAAPDPEAGPLAPASAYAFVVARSDPSLGASAWAEAVDQVRRHAQPRHVIGLAAASEAAILVASDAPAFEVDVLAAELLAAARRHCGTGRVHVGVSAARSRLRELHQAYLEAAWAADRCAADGEDAVRRWDMLGADRTILPLLGERPPATLLPDPILRLLECKDAESLLATLEMYLDHACDAQAVADLLGIHRSSLWQRLHRIEGLAGVDLRDGDDRLEVHLGLRLMRLAQPAARTNRCGG